MSQGDRQVLLGQGVAPESYTVPNSVELIPRSVNATFDGTGAAGSFRPTVEILSDGGVVVARVPCQTTVSAGGSAEVTFAPFLRAEAASAAGTTIAWGVLQGPVAPPASVPAYPTAGYVSLVDFTGGGFFEDGSGVFSWDPALPNWMQCSVAPQPGLWIVQAWMSQDSGTSPINVDDVFLSLRQSNPAGSGDHQLEVPSVASNLGQRASTVNLEADWMAIGWQPSDGFSTPVGFGLEVDNFDASARPVVPQTPKLAVTLIAT